MAMMVEQLEPRVVGATAPLVARLASEAQAQGLSRDEAAMILAALPPNLRQAMCFNDRLTGVWKYEFGEPLELPRTQTLLWGTLWVPVKDLLTALRCALVRVPTGKLNVYLARLDDAVRHRETLAEMMPLARCTANIGVDFEVAGLGQGNRTVDWVLAPDGGRRVLLDVKQRIADLIHAIDRKFEGKVVPAPTHDTGLVFRSIETKFADADPDVQLQGAWIATDLQQDASELPAAFEKLDGRKVHFAILGDWEPGVHLLVRREQDRAYLTEMLGLTETNSRFVFQRGGK